MKILTEKDVEHLIIGAAILGTGGGGNPEEGLKMLKKDLKEGRKLAIVSLDEVPILWTLEQHSSKQTLCRTAKLRAQSKSHDSYIRTITSVKV